jgi:hypothetical protein
VPFNSRAMRPSMPSSTPAMMMAVAADSNLPLSAKRIAVMPAHSANSVRMLGMSRLSDRVPIGLTRTRGRRIQSAPPWRGGCSTAWPGRIDPFLVIPAQAGIQGER